MAFSEGRGAQEIIRCIREAVCEMIYEYFRSSGCLPTRIIFYRDGVSEGQFQQV